MSTVFQFYIKNSSLILLLNAGNVKRYLSRSVNERNNYNKLFDSLFILLYWSVKKTTHLWIRWGTPSEIKLQLKRLGYKYHFFTLTQTEKFDKPKTNKRMNRSLITKFVSNLKYDTFVVYLWWYSIIMQNFQKCLSKTLQDIILDRSRPKSGLNRLTCL